MRTSCSPTSPEAGGSVRTAGRPPGSVPPLVSVIVPSLDAERDGNLESLLADLADQSVVNKEVFVVQGVRPNGRARNAGASQARGRYLIFIDDDVRLGHRHVLENLVENLAADPTLGLVGASQLTPPDAGAFQRAVASQLPRMHFPVVDRPTESDMVTHMCLALPAELWRQVGGEHDDLVRGTDPDLRDRVRAAGRRVVVVPGTWAYHAAPASLRALLSWAWRGGRGAAWVRRHHPDRAFDVPDGPFAGRAPVRGPAYRAARFAGGLVWAVLRGRPLRVVADLAYAAGYASVRLARREPSPEALA